MRKDTEEFLKSAEEDLSAAEELFRTKKYRIVVFHCQQAAEKYLKAYLLEKFNKYPFIHSISELIELATELDADFEYLFNINAQTLDEYYTKTRYPPLLKVSEEEAWEAIKIAEKVKDFILKKLNIEK